MFAKLAKRAKKKDPSRPLARSRVFDPAEAPEARRTIFISSIVVAVAFAILLSRLWYLQLLQGDHFRSLSENNRIRLVDVPPSRGLIFDAKGRLLAENRPAFALAVVPEDVNDWEELGTRLNKLVGITPEELKKAREVGSQQPPFKPVRLRSHLDREQLAVLETFRYELPGIRVMVEYRRAYLNAKETSHVIGYLGEINQQELAEAPKALYRIGDYVGRYGLEKSRERVLHGRRGARQVEVDAMGRELKLLSEVDPVPGHNLTLTLDLKLQRAAAAGLGDEVGAVVALDPKSGQVYCMYSSPSFDQNNFITGMSARLWEALAGDPYHPLKNRAISGLYPPGSTYKIITASAALAEGVVNPQTSILCPGEIPFGRRTYKCWALKKGGHGNVALHRAIRESCDVYFYRVGLRLGVDRLAKYARAFGLGSLTGVPLPSESAGLVPDSEWKKKRFGEPWQDGETLSLAIGQGFNLTTPIQLARMTAVVANKGRLVTPTLVKAVSPADGSDPVPEPPPVSTRVPVNPKDLELVHQGLVAVVMEPGGTASATRLPNISVAGKTGTAQVVALKHEKLYGHEDNLPWKYRNHALFVAYAPAEDPTIALAVVVEHGGHGGSDAAPVARRVLEAFFDLPVKERHKTRPGPLASHLDPVEAVAAAALAAAQKKAAPAAEQAATKPEAKKPEPRKAEQKKPEPKKPEPKKPEAKKPEQKKAEPKKPAPEANGRFAPKPFVPDSSDPATNPTTYRGRGR
ncbi:MAG: penicillin-binding protein 2 [Desulfarculus sp.]|nr:penicillin-binding protein 2 [Desulfarculus sp.]